MQPSASSALQKCEIDKETHKNKLELRCFGRIYALNFVFLLNLTSSTYSL
jgi:hypothetical protein